MTSRTLREIAQRIPDFEAYALHEYGLRSYEDAGVFVPPNFNPDPTVRNLLKDLRRLGVGFEELVVDPGLLQYFNKFKLFMANHSGLSPWEARDLFAQDPQMQVTVYRGLMLTQDEADGIGRHGIQSTLARVSNDREADIIRTGSNRLKGLIRHIKDQRQESAFISVTTYPGVAVGAARTYGQAGAGRAIRLYEIQMSKVDLVRRSYEGDQGLWQTFLPNRVDGIELISQDESRVVPLDGQIEQFALWEIAAKQVREVAIPVGAGFKLSMRKE